MIQFAIIFKRLWFIKVTDKSPKIYISITIYALVKSKKLFIYDRR